MDANSRLDDCAMNSTRRNLLFVAAILGMGAALPAQTPRPRAVWIEFPKMGESLARIEENSEATLPETEALARLQMVSIHLGRQPQDLAGSSIGIRVNAEAANVVMTQRNLEEGIVCDIPLTQNPTVALHGGGNAIEVFYRDRWNQPHYSVFLLDSFTRNPKPTPPEFSTPMSSGRHFALLVGISLYHAQGETLPPLAYAGSDAKAFRDFLLTPQGGSYKQENVKLLLNEEATLDNLRAALKDLARTMSPQDSLLIYLNLHGGYDSNNPEHKYLLTYDSDLHALAASALPVEELPAWLASYAKTRHIALFADVCHTAKIGDGLPPRSKPANLINTYLYHAFEKHDLASVEAGEGGQISQEGSRWGEHGVFTYFLLKGLAGEADGTLSEGRQGKLDGKVTTAELFFYVQKNVQQATGKKQYPLISLSAGGVFDLARPAAGAASPAPR